MADLLDYLRWRGDLKFSQVPPGPVDALIFSALSYLHFGGSVTERPDIPISLRDAAVEFFEAECPENRCRVKTDLSLLQTAAETERFGSTLLLRKLTHQFCNEFGIAPLFCDFFQFISIRPRLMLTQAGRYARE